MFQIPGGLKVGKCALVGRQIGVGNAIEAKRISRICMIFALLLDIVEFTVLFIFREEVINIFVAQSDLRGIAKEVIQAILISISIDFMQTI